MLGRSSLLFSVTVNSVAICGSRVSNGSFLKLFRHVGCSFAVARCETILLGELLQLLNAGFVGLSRWGGGSGLSRRVSSAAAAGEELVDFLLRV